MRIIWLFFLLITTLSAGAQEAQFQPFRCSVVFTLDGPAYTSFREQAEQLRHHLSSNRISLIDLNHWQEGGSYQSISGRQRAQLRTRFELPRALNQAIMVNREGNIIARHSGFVTLVELLLLCQ